MLQLLAPDRVAKWWIPDEFAFIDEVPKTSGGKFDKKVLRRQLAEDELEGRVAVGRHGAVATGDRRTITASHSAQSTEPG